MKSEPDESEPDSDADASESATKAPNKRANDAEIALIDAYCKASGSGFPTAAGKAINMAKVLVKAGRTPEEVRGCGEWLLADPWHATKGIAFETIVKHIDNYRQVVARQGGARPEPATLEDRFGRHVDAVAASAVPRRGKPQVIY